MPFLNTPDGVVVFDDSGMLWNFVPSDPHNPVLPDIPSALDVLMRQGPYGGGGSFPAGFGQSGPPVILEPPTGGGGFSLNPGYRAQPYRGVTTNSPFGTAPSNQPAQESLLPLLLISGLVLLLLQ